jgi:hypothetical protein
VPAQAEGLGFTRSVRSSRLNDLSKSSRNGLPSWYTDRLRLKVACAVRDGRVDHAQAAELDRLMTELFDSHSPHAERWKRSG